MVGLRSAAGVDPVETWPSIHACAQGELVGIEGVSAPSGLFGFLAPGGREASVEEGGILISSPQMKTLFAKK